MHHLRTVVIVIFQYRAFTPDSINKILNQIPNNVEIAGFSGASGYHPSLADLEKVLTKSKATEKTFFEKLTSVVRRQHRVLRRKTSMRFGSLAQRRLLDGKLAMWQRISSSPGLKADLLNKDALVALDYQSVYSIWQLSRLSDSPETIHGIPAMQLWLDKLE